MTADHRPVMFARCVWVLCGNRECIPVSVEGELDFEDGARLRVGETVGSASSSPTCS